MQNRTTAEAFNEELRTYQQKWYSKLPREYRDHDKFSSPFCCGVSEKTIEEKKSGMPLIMFVGEEPRNWWFNYGNHHHECDIKYLQGYSIAYFEKQLYDLSREINGNDYYAEYQDEKNSFARRNTSDFWTFIKRLNIKYAICWNNLDKLHKLKDKKTVLINKKEEHILHSIKINDKTLLLNEIETVEPDYIIFLGKAYKDSIGDGLMIDRDFDNLPELEKNATVVEISTSAAKRALWMCHPASLSRSGKKLLQPTIEKVFELLGK